MCENERDREILVENKMWRFKHLSFVIDSHVLHVSQIWRFEHLSFVIKIVSVIIDFQVLPAS